MKIKYPDHHKPVYAALKRAGYRVGEIVSEAKKTIITVFPCEENDEKKNGAGKKSRNGRQ